MDDAKKSEVSKLRLKAEELLKKNSVHGRSMTDLSEIQKLMHELEVYQIELEMQNEELLLAKEQAEVTARNFTKLFDFAPSGYFSLSREDKISELNLNGAKMLGKERHSLINSRFSSFVSGATRPIFNQFLENAFRNHTSQTCGLTLITNTNFPKFVFLSGIVNENEDECLVTMVDLSHLSQIENELKISELQRINILNDIEDVVWSLSWPEMAVIYISPSVEKLFGRPVQDFIANPSLWSLMVHPNDKHLSDEAFNRLHNEGEAVRMCRIVRPDGSIAWIQDKSKIICDASGNPIRIDGVSRDITESKLTVIYREISQEILHRLNQPGDLKNAIRDVLDILKIQTGFDAVGIRLQDGDDFPYFAQKGFSTDFLSTENSLIERKRNGGLCHNKEGKISLECTCGLVISGNNNRENQLFTDGGSIWTNDSLPFLDIPSSEDPRLHPRNRCIHLDYSSVALVPIRKKDQIIGLIQFNDKRKGCFTNNMIERLEGIATHIGEALLRKQAEDELQKSNELLSLFLQHSPIFAFIKEVNPSESRTLKASENYIEMVGIPVSEMIGKTMHELFPPELAASITSDDWSVVTEGKILEIEEVLNGHSYTSIKFPIILGDQKLLAGYSIDITEQKLMEKKLQESERKYRLLFETVQEGILITQGANFKFVNPKVLELTGFSETELLIMPFLEVVHPDDKEMVRINYLKRMNNEPANDRYHLRIIKKDGSQRWIEISGVKTEWEGQPAVINFVTDITDQLLAENALKESESRAQALINAIPDMMFLLNKEGVYLNYKAAREDLAYDIQPLIGLKNRDIAPPEFADLVDEKISLTLQTREMQVFEYQLQMPSGAIVDHEARMVPSGLDEVVAIVRNITEQKQTALVIKLKNEELEKVNSEKDKFFSVIAHDLLNPFQSLLGFSSAMGEDLLSLPLDKIQKIAVNMRKSANTLFFLLENLLDWSQMQRGIIGFKPKPLKLARTVSEIIDLTRTIADRKMIVISPVIPEEFIVLADRQMFESLMRNLIFNAVKFTPNGGQVTISAIVLPDKLIEISVTDTGIGMDQILIGNLFKLDPQANRKGTEGEPSTGLGLIICKDFIEKHGGKLVVESEVGKGSSFRFTLKNQEA